jgi:hypothetical protein
MQLRVMPAPGFFEVGSTAPVAPLVSNDIDLSQLAGVAQAGAAVEGALLAGPWPASTGNEAGCVRRHLLCPA